MRRLASVLAAVAALVAVLLLPEVSRPRLAALEAHELLAREVTLSAPGSERDGRRMPLWEAVLSGPAARRTADGGTEVALHGARISGDEVVGLELSLVLRRSLVRGLRQYAGDEHQPLTFIGEETPDADRGIATFHLELAGSELALHYGVRDASEEVLLRTGWAPPSRTSLLPPLVAVVLAVLLRRPVLALLTGVLTGAVLVERATGLGWWKALDGGHVAVVRTYFLDEYVDPERRMIVGFVVFMLAMVGVMTRSGGIRGLMDAVARLARDVRRTQVATFLMGLAVFFDDYANTILVGSTMRPLTDRFRISREKLSYIVDSTAAPVAGISVFSTWIAFEVSTFSAQLPAAGLSPADGYAVFFATIPYSFYCIFALVLVGAVAISGRDFGPMLAAERRARSTGALLRPGATPMVSAHATGMEVAAGVAPRAWRALLPLATFLAVTLVVIVARGGGFAEGARLATIEGWAAVLSDGSGSYPLFVGSLAGLGVAVGCALTAGLLTDVLGAAWTTIRSMGVAFAILFLAWMIGSVCRDLGTAPYLTAVVGDAVDARLLPTLLFLLAGVVAFATGSSWSTMSILLPLVVGLAYNLGVDAGLEPEAVESGRLLMTISIAAVLSGAIFGDHCSPISDTTVMSSIASASDHIDHVRTQAPYALLTMAVAVLVGYLPCTYFGLSPWLALGLGAALLVLVVLWRARPAQERVAS